MCRKAVLALAVFLGAQGAGAGGNREFRATWVITWEHIDPALTPEQNMQNVRAILDRHRAAHMNAVLWQCRQSGTAYYVSSFEPWGYYANYRYPGYDPLAYAIEEAHKRGMELHAWFNVFQCSSTYPGAPAVEHPEWVCRDREGNPMTSNMFLSPGLDDVRAYLVAVALEIVRNYDIDGLHLDYVRWPEYTSSPLSRALARAAERRPALDGVISPELLQDLQENAQSRYLYDIDHPYSAGVPAGFGSWEEWWRWSVTEFVRVLHDSIQAIKPWVRLSVAALGNYNWGSWQGYGTVYQDAALWFNQGYIDQLAPMHYHWLTPDGFYSMLVGPTNAWGPWIQQGIAEGRLFTVGPGSYRLAEEKVWYRHPAIVEACRRVPWVDGFQFFSYGSWQAYRYWEEAGQTFFERRTKIRSGWSDYAARPAPPTIFLAKIDSLRYEITVVPPPGLTESHRFAVYRTEKDTPDPENDWIVDFHFGTAPFTLTEQFTGTQDYNGRYRYYATVLDRFWNESDPSNTVQTDPIPSFPPTVVATEPAEGDTVPATAAISLVFSKTVDPAGVDTSIRFLPPVEILQMSWIDGRTLQIVPAHLAFGTSYTLIVTPGVRDVNGRRLDGNGDGVEGDPFFLRFFTFPVDDRPPRVVRVYPGLADGETLDVDGVINLLFDELIEASTVSDSSVAIRSGLLVPPVQALHSVVMGRSLLSVRAWEPLQPDTEYSLELLPGICDTTGNRMAELFAMRFRTSQARYTEVRLIDGFSQSGNWEQPSYSGSTSGIVVSRSSFGITRELYLPASATRPVERYSGLLTYEWEETPPPQGYLLREYLRTGAPRDVVFDTSYTLQVYLYGDNSGNLFRFCLDEGTATDWPYHEVSQWVRIDWYGWRLVEWRLGDAGSVGTWIGNGRLDGSRYRIDSFQLTRGENGALRGKLYFDNLRIVKKTTQPAGVVSQTATSARTFALLPAYPNPFNVATVIPFDLVDNAEVRLEIFDLRGRRVAVLVDQPLAAGHYRVRFEASDLPSGTYLCRLTAGGHVMTRKLVLAR
ncbi:MAG: family 10 glycosylhydrolase [candidate division KSB1 bacterium]|nr:family 10 glycosylhydrolase [candidate division KSB1 bacterium]